MIPINYYKKLARISGFFILVPCILSFIAFIYSVFLFFVAPGIILLIPFLFIFPIGYSVSSKYYKKEDYISAFQINLVLTILFLLFAIFYISPVVALKWHRPQ
jgi:hypothetical protein